MTHAANPIEVYVEMGQKRAFAVALDWPGWARSGRDETSALQTLVDYGPRYERVLQQALPEFRAPSAVADLVVVERQPGTATTDFGAPDLALARDEVPVEPGELERWRTILRACWDAFDRAAGAAQGKTLSKGPRGGGRDLPKMIEHVRDVDLSYLRTLGGTANIDKAANPLHVLPKVRETILETLTRAVNGEIEPYGPRGGKRWTPRYFVRRLAWHELDHAWEIEDRVQ